VERDRPHGWHLVRFIEHLDAWVERESPDQDTRLRVVDWIMSRHDDPYTGVIREPGSANLWYGRIPGTRDADRTIVVCSYYVFDSVKIVRCNRIGRPGHRRGAAPPPQR